MKKKTILITILIMAMTPLFAEEKELNLQKVADDLNFSNASEFVKLDRPDKALEALYEYLEVYIRGIHRHEAYHLIADIYFKRFQYQKAVKTYRSLYEEFSREETGIEGYFRAALCYKKMGYDEKAADIFREILEYHPSSPWARQSKMQLDIMSIINTH